MMNFGEFLHIQAKFFEWTRLCPNRFIENLIDSRAPSFCNKNVSICTQFTRDSKIISLIWSKLTTNKIPGRERFFSSFHSQANMKLVGQLLSIFVISTVITSSGASSPASEFLLDRVYASDDSPGKFMNMSGYKVKRANRTTFLVGGDILLLQPMDDEITVDLPRFLVSGHILKTISC